MRDGMASADFQGLTEGNEGTKNKAKRWEQNI
jgi:hypothetical protein